MEIKTLTVLDYQEIQGLVDRVTFQPLNISYIRCAENLVTRQGMNLYRVTVFMPGDDPVTIHVDSLDLRKLEEAVGGYDVVI